jgi:hypothetical protein
MGADAASAFLIGRLAQEGRTPVAVLRATSGPLPGVTGVHVFAVEGERLWLVQPRLLGEPAIASVPLRDVGEVTLRTGPGRNGRDVVSLRLGLPAGTLTFRALDDADTAARFVDALRNGPAPE